MGNDKDNSRTIALNRKAYHDFEILETFEAGIMLQGTEVKSARNHGVNLKDNYARVENEAVWLYNVHISPYEFGNRENHPPVRPRKLLLHKKEIRRLIGKTQEKGLTLIAVKMYWKGNHIKVALALAKGKKVHDKRHAIKEKDLKRQIERAIRRDL